MIVKSQCIKILVIKEYKTLNIRVFNIRTVKLFSVAYTFISVLSSCIPLHLGRHQVELSLK